MKRLFWILAAVFAVVATPTLSAATPEGSDKSAVLKVTNDNFDALAGQHKLLIVDFWAPWCGPCQMLGPVIEEVAEEYEGKAKVCKVNVDEEGSLASEFAVVSIPTIIIFKDGKQVEKLVGVRSFDDFCDFFEIEEETDNVSVGGWVTELLGKLPEVGDEVTFENLKLVVTEVDSHRVENIEVTCEKTEE